MSRRSPRLRASSEAGGSRSPSSPSSPSSPAAAAKRKTALALFLNRRPLSTHQTRIVCDYLRPLFARVPQKLVEDLTGSPRKVLLEWEAQGAPRSAGGTWPLPELLRWLKDKWVRTSRKGGGGDVREVEAQIDLEIKQEKLRREKHINRLREGRVTPNDQVDQLLLELQSLFLAAVQGLPKLAASLAGKPVPVIRRTLDGVHKELRRGLASKMKAAKSELLRGPVK